MKIYFKTKSKEQEELFSWDIPKIDPMTDGRIGLRHMYTRSALYKNFKIHSK